MKGRSFIAAALVALSACRESPPPAPAHPPAQTAEASSASAPVAETEAAAPSPFVPARVTHGDKVMGTHINFIAYTTPAVDQDKAQALFRSAIAEVRRVEALMTTWSDSSEVSRINAAAGKEPVVVGDETLAVIKKSLDTSKISEGTFDITFQTLHGLWKFDEDLDPHPPNPADVKKRLSFLGWEHVKVDAAKKSVFIDKKGTQISLGGIAKGYGVDKAAEILEKGGLSTFLIQAGGDLLARGKKPDGKPWQAGIRDPRGPASKYFAMLEVTDHAFSTAGDYERSYIVGGKRYHHIIDPRTGYPATACRSVTIWAKTAFEADAIDDAVFILGPKKGLAIVDALDDVGAVVVDSKNNLWVSKRLKGKLALVAAPTDGI